MNVVEKRYKAFIVIYMELIVIEKHGSSPLFRHNYADG